jgi:hypothetical protein
MIDRLDPLDPDVAALLPAAKALDPVTAEAHARVEAALAARLAALGGGTGGDYGGGNAGAPHATGAGSATAAAAPLGRLSRGVLTAGLVGFGLGLGVGVGATIATRPPPQRRLS